MAKRKKKLKKKFIKSLLIILLVLVVSECGNYLYATKKELKPVEKHDNYYYSYDFGYVFTKSKKDFNNNGVDDYTDILNGAKKVAKINPKYVSNYYEGGYPPKTEGVCTDLIASSLINAGYYIKNYISQDIKQTFKDKIYNVEVIDNNIDYRRVENQEKFFKRYTENLTTDIYETGSFQAGDIVTFDQSDHIAIISDKWNKNAIPYLIQNSRPEQKQKEEDRLEITDMKVTGHYRFTYNEKLQKIIEEVGDIS